MNTVPWKEIIELLKFALWVAIGINGIHLLQTVIVEAFGKICPHCSKKI